MTATRMDPPLLTPKQIDRFWSRIDRSNPDECWEWQAGRAPGGYGSISLKPPGRKVRAHRIAHLLTTGKWPPLVIHSCDNPPCCNPAHLRAAQTHRENGEDKIRKGRQGNTGSDHWTHKHPERRLTGEKNPMYGRREHMLGDKNPARRFPERIREAHAKKRRETGEWVLHGSQTAMAKLNEEQVAEIRRRYVRRKVTHKMLAQEYGVTSSLILQIVRGMIWKHVPLYVTDAQVFSTSQSEG